MRVVELRVSRNMTEEELFQSVNDLFEGRALTWYRSIRRLALPGSSAAQSISACRLQRQVV
jgi:hypothetical protein